MEEGLLNIFRNCVGNGKCHVLKLSSSQLSFLAPPNRKKPSSFISDPLQPPPNLISTIIFASSVVPLTRGRKSLPLLGNHMHPFFLHHCLCSWSKRGRASKLSPDPPPRCDVSSDGCWRKSRGQGASKRVVTNSPGGFYKCLHSLTISIGGKILCSSSFFSFWHWKQEG